MTTEPAIIVDSREQNHLIFTQFMCEQGTLMTGDYFIRGMEHLFAIERKSLADLTGCICTCGQKRFEKELHRLRGFSI
jgi:DNA excision repair protein ERCC-4